MLPTWGAGAATGWQIWHDPYLQLGDAPLPGFYGSQTDRVQIRWQVRGSGDPDVFDVAYRAVGSDRWSAAPAPSPEQVGEEDRVAYHSDLVGLAWDTVYEYRVQQIRDDAVFAEFVETFRTRIEPGNLQRFEFAAYGDSACGCDLAPFRSVQASILDSDAAFALLLGDNVYEEGTYIESDARFRSDLSPEATEWRAQHVDYVAYGNHDIASDGRGQATEAAYGVPLMRPGSAPAIPPASERSGHDYSFDYGSVHFVTFDSNALHDQDRLAGVAAWIEADLRASQARWKIVFAHHPVAGVPDKPEAPDGNYYRTLVAALDAGGADLLLVGHSHTFGWSYPLTGNRGDTAVYVLDADRSYPHGLGVIQVVSGVGGRGLRGGGFDQFPFVAAGFSSQTDPSSQFGYALIDVSADRLVVSYVGADDGSVIARFQIDRPLHIRSGWWLRAPLAV